jgi:16S rRNA (uracil1498-N3)-methyltransferase
MIRVLVPVPSPPPERLRVRGERFHHLVHVLRIKPGETVEAFDGSGRAFSARVVSVDEDSVELVLGESREERPQRRIAIVQGLPKGEKLEWIIEKATELGAAEILPVSTARAVVRLEGDRAAKRLARWRRIAEEAARQCGRADVPEVLPPRPLASVFEVLPRDARVLILDEAERTRRLSQAAREAPHDAPLAVVAGPEGGLERGEVAALAARGAIPVSLGQNVVRTETAALAALSVLRHLDGHLG